MRLLIITAALAALTASAQTPPQPAAPPAQLGALAPENINKSRPKPGFDITGTWLHAFSRDNPFTFAPPAGFKLTPEAQVQYDAAKKARSEGKAYHDDIGACWPAGLPVLMTRVWPIAMIQKPTVIYMVSGFMNSVRIIYLDGRKHTDPDIIIPSFNGESIGHWEGDTLVVEANQFNDDSWLTDNGAFHSVELTVTERLWRVGDTLRYEAVATDPKVLTEPWKVNRTAKLTDVDLVEATPCIDKDLNHVVDGTHHDNPR